MRPLLAHVPVPLRRASAVLAAGVTLGLLANAVHPAGIPLAQPVYSQAEVGQCSAPATAPPVVTGISGAVPPLSTGDLAPALPVSLSPRDAARLRSAGRVAFGDLRPPDRYAEGHVAGAVHLPCQGRRGQEALRHLASEVPLVLYDADGRSPELQSAALTAAQRGVHTVYTLAGGFSAWLAAGLPAESGPCDHCGLP